MKHIRTTRRAFMGHLGLVAGMGALAYTAPGVLSIRPATAAVTTRPAGAKPVVSVFMDMPWVDMSGRAEPYIPPRGTAVPARLTLAEDFGNYQYYHV